MIFSSEDLTSSGPINIDDKQIKRKLYHKPLLASLGDLRSLTLGGSFGAGESSGGGSRKRALISPYGDFPIYNPDGTLWNPNDPLNTP